MISMVRVGNGIRIPSLRNRFNNLRRNMSVTSNCATSSVIPTLNVKFKAKSPNPGFSQEPGDLSDGCLHFFDTTRSNSSRSVA